MVYESFEDLCKGFSKLNREARIFRLRSYGLLSETEKQILNQSSSSDFIKMADSLVENVIGCFALPLGVATNFRVDGKDYLIPMAIEETSVIASASRTARWVREQGSIKTDILGDTIIGQIHLPCVKHLEKFRVLFDKLKNQLVEEANASVVPGLLKRGGGVKSMLFRVLKSQEGQQVFGGAIHVLLDPCDAMGANAVTQVCEYVKGRLGQLTEEHLGMAIVSNLVDSKLTQATITLDGVEKRLAEAISEASLFAEQDPYRAATNNKGVMNGIDAVLIATGNDWRAVEAGVHAYAARTGQYRSITRWEWKGDRLIGCLKAPIVVGTVGGVTRLHPLSQLSLSMMGISQADHLSRVVAAVGLVQNLGALRTLVSEGIMKGHMKLHIDNMMLAVGVKEEEREALRTCLQTRLKQKKKISLSDARLALDQLRR